MNRAHELRRDILAAASVLLAPGAAYTRQTRSAVDGLFSVADALDNPLATKPEQSARRATRAAFAKQLRNPKAPLTADEKRLLNIAVGAPATGGVLVPTLVWPELSEKLQFYSSVASVARVVETDSGGPLLLPTTDDVANVGTLIAENAQAPASDFTFGSATLNSYMFTSGIVPVSYEIVQDAGLEIVGILTDLFAARLGRGQNGYFTTGTGTAGQPQGIVTGASSGVILPTGNITSITLAGLLALYNSVDPAYRASPSCAWMVHDDTLLAVKSLTDTAGRPLWTADFLAAPDGSARQGTLLGKPVIVNNSMATMAANAKSVLFGDMAQYFVRLSRGATILRFDDSAFARKGTVGFVAFARADGRHISPGSAGIKYLQNSAT